MKKPSGNSIFLIIATLVVAAGLYWYFFAGDTAVETPLSSGTGPAPTSVAQVKFDTLTSELGPISFNLSILSDPRFNALVDLTTPVNDEPTGRKDPFAPITGVSTKTP